jgi:hypothetical protein
MLAVFHRTPLAQLHHTDYSKNNQQSEHTLKYRFSLEAGITVVHAPNGNMNRIKSSGRSQLHKSGMAYATRIAGYQSGPNRRTYVVIIDKLGRLS